MYLLDASVWINAINGNSKTVKFLNQLTSDTLGLNGLIYTEVLQGANTQKKFDTYQRYLSAQPFYGFKDEKISYQLAAQIYFNCRKAGITIRSSIDCLIAQCAIENNLILLHNDQDFIQIAKIILEFKQIKANEFIL